MVAPGPLASATIAAFLVVLLARACWHKLDRYLETVGFAQGYGLVPDRWAAPIVRALTVAEAGIALALLVPGTRQPGGLAAAALFGGYGTLMAAALLQGRLRIDCGCGGAPQVVSVLTLLRNAFLTVLGLAVAVLPSATVPPREAAVAIAAALVLAATYGVAEKLTSHLPHIRRGEN